MFVHGKETRVLLDKWDLSPWMRQASMDMSVEVADTGHFGSADRTSIVGHRGATYDLGGMMSVDTTVAHVDLLRVLQGVPEAVPQPHSVLSIAIGGFAVGQPVWGGFGWMSGYSPSQPFNDVVMLSPKFISDDSLSLGVSLHDVIAGVTASGNSASVDHGAASTGGSINLLHVIANDRDGALAAKVQHSADGSTWADLATFASVAAGNLTAPGQRVATTGTVNRYLRSIWTLGGSSGSVTFAVITFRTIPLH